VVFLGRSQTSVQAQITDAILRGEGLIVLTGESGSGKTILCRYLLQSLSVPTFESFISATTGPLLTSEDVLRRMLLDFRAGPGLASSPSAREGLADLVARLNRFLQSMASSTRAIMVLDDAHRAQPELLTQLRTLGNMKAGSERLLQVILIGQPALESLFERPEAAKLEQRVARWCRLQPLMTTEVAPYIRHKLAAGRTESQSTSLVAPAAMRIAAALSKGNPRTIDQLCDRAFQVAFEKRARRIGQVAMTEAAHRLNMEVPAAPAPTIKLKPVPIAVTAATIAVVLMGVWVVRSLSVGQPKSLAKPVAARVPRPSSPPQTSTPGPVPAAPNPGVASAGSSPQVGQLPATDSFVIIAASFRGQELATEMAKELVNLSLPAFVRSDSPWYVVMVGPYLTVEEARSAAARISSRDFPDARIQKHTVTDESER
jgi:type II secretory pathway predicted ATPase ExeA